MADEMPMNQKLTELSDEELRQLPDATAEYGSEFWNKRQLEMDWRFADRQLEASRNLVKFSKRLVYATWVLVFATVALVATGIGQIIEIAKN